MFRLSKRKTQKHEEKAKEEKDEAKEEEEEDYGAGAFDRDFYQAIPVAPESPVTPLTPVAPVAPAAPLTQVALEASRAPETTAKNALLLSITMNMKPHLTHGGLSIKHSFCKKVSCKSKNYKKRTIKTKIKST